MTLPDIIILFGAPASGKGTQAENLKHYLTEYDYEHFDFGAQLRKFVNTHVGDYKNLSLETLPTPSADDDSQTQLALQAASIMLQGNPIPAELLWQILGTQINAYLDSNKRLIIEGLGRTVEDARRFGKLAFNRELKVAIFHLCITVEESLKRSHTRYYVNGFVKPFSSYEEALKVSSAEHQPWQRFEDKDVTKIQHRYKVLYADIYAKVLSTLQVESLANLFIIDGRDTIEDDFERIKLYLDRFYQIKL